MKVFTQIYRLLALLECNLRVCVCVEKRNWEQILQKCNENTFSFFMCRTLDKFTFI